MSFKFDLVKKILKKAGLTEYYDLFVKADINDISVFTTSSVVLTYMVFKEREDHLNKFNEHATKAKQSEVDELEVLFGGPSTSSSPPLPVLNKTTMLFDNIERRVFSDGAYQCGQKQPYPFNPMHAAKEWLAYLGKNY